MPTVRSLLQEAARTLTGSATPQLDTLVLLEWVSHRDRGTLLAEYSAPAEEILSPLQISDFRTVVTRRARGEPIAYITGMKEFYGREFLVGPGVLIPRPDSESIVQRGVELLREGCRGSCTIFDCFTGSGCIGLSTALTYEEDFLLGGDGTVTLTLGDVDDHALEWCRRNVKKHGDSVSSRVRISVKKGDLLTGLPKSAEFDLITANPPYLTETETEEALSAGWGEPSVALAAGMDGLEIIREFLPGAFSHLRPGGYLVMEHGFSQGDAVRELAGAAGFIGIRTGRDLADNDRYLEAKKPAEQVR